MKRILAALALALPLAAVAQQGYIHGNGDPRVTSKDCGQSRLYIDDTTGQMYTAGVASPVCIWSLPGGSAHQNNLANSCTTTGPGTAYVCATSPPVVPVDGDHYLIKFAVVNLAAATLNVNGLGGAALRRYGGTNVIAPGDITANTWQGVTWNSTLGVWQMDGQLTLTDYTIAGGTAVMTVAAIASGCGTTVSPTATSGTLANVLATDSIIWSFSTAPDGTQAGLTPWAGAGAVNFAYCGIAETPSAQTINWKVVR